MPCAFAQSGDATGQIRRYLALSRQFEKEQPDSAVYYAGLGVTLAEKTKKETLLADLLLQLGEVNMRHHHTDLARQFYNKALGLFRRQHDAGGVARTYDALGLLDADTADFGRAMQYYRDSRDSSGIITTYIAMGKAAQQKGRQEQAISHYLRALAQYEHREHRPEAYYSLLETVGRLYEAKGDTATAMHYFRSGIRDSLQEGLPETAVHLMNAEGEILEQQHEEKRALAVYKQALAEARRQHQADEQAEALLHIAGILKQTDAKSSITDLKQALVLAEKLRQPQLEARIYAALAAVYRQEKNYGEAMNALEEQHRLVDSLLRTDTVKEINALENSYALESSEEKVSNLQHINRLER
jgi:tetratricopeptide (TPR) repeat protein